MARLHHWQGVLLFKYSHRGAENVFVIQRVDPHVHRQLDRTSVFSGGFCVLRARNWAKVVSVSRWVASRKTHLCTWISGGLKISEVEFGYWTQMRGRNPDERHLTFLDLLDWQLVENTIQLRSPEYCTKSWALQIQKDRKTSQRLGLLALMFVKFSSWTSTFARTLLGQSHEQFVCQPHSVDTVCKVRGAYCLTIKGIGCSGFASIAWNNPFGNSCACSPRSVLVKLQTIEKGYYSRRSTRRLYSASLL
jgi:hypothetical protein